MWVGEGGVKNCNKGKMEHFDAFSVGNSEQRNSFLAVSFWVAAGLCESVSYSVQEQSPVLSAPEFFRLPLTDISFAFSETAKQRCWFKVGGRFFFLVCFFVSPVSQNLIYIIKLIFYKDLFVIFSVKPS